MRDVHVITEIWRFECLSCQSRWEHAYEAWHVDDGRGGNAVTWRRAGTVSMPPWADPSCADCSDLRVRVLPPRADFGGGSATRFPKQPGPQ
ncbi:MAG: hypothetical protein QOE54_2188 [Streptosporangiaceae bacterium]|jgi:hypothetical protein|nr:hypothetical protein [Streptosporangiaceae bacterium]MDX6429822.1 hypothetical protein [Streptosporangiaceae bacterium]